MERTKGIVYTYLYRIIANAKQLLLTTSTTANSLNMEADEAEDDGPFNLPFGQLYFGFQVVPPPSEEDKETQKDKHVFTGTGQTLRNKKK